MKYSREKLLNLYKLLPEQLKEALFSAKVTDEIYTICKKNNLNNSQISQIAESIGYVFLGLLSLKEFKNSLIKEVKLTQETSENIYNQINDYIFFPLKGLLEKMYNTKINLINSEQLKEKKTVIDSYRESLSDVE